MLSRRTWFALTAITVAFGVWLSFQVQDIVYSEREVDGVVYESKVVCGTGPGMVFAGEFVDVRGAATQSDCLKVGRARVLELIGLAFLSGLMAFVGVRYGKEPPRPIRTELPDLPKGEAGFDGRKSRTPAE